MNRWLLLVFIVVVCPRIIADEPSYKKLPWHLVVVRYDIGEQRTVRTIEVDYQLFDPMPDTGHNLFLVPFFGRLCGKASYAGVLNRGFQVGEKDVFTTITGHGGVFTQFGTNSPAALARVDGGYTMLSDHEGPMASVRRYATHYKKGLYTLRLSVRERERLGRNKAHPRVVVDMTLIRPADQMKAEVGGLVFEADEFTIGPRFGSFCEAAEDWDAVASQFRGAENYNEAEIPRMRYAVGNWRIDGERVTAKSIHAEYRTDVPQRAKVYTLESCPDKELKKSVDKALAGEDTLIYVVSDKAYTRAGDKVELREPEYLGRQKFDAVIEMLKK